MRRRDVEVQPVLKEPARVLHCGGADDVLRAARAQVRSHMVC